MHLDLHGTRYQIDTDIDDDGRGTYQWRGDVPSCPSCGCPLSVGDEESQHSFSYFTVTSHPKTETTHVLCESCGWESEAL